MQYAPKFIEWINDVANYNELTFDKVLSMWKEYAETCRGYDQSPVTGEFLQWNKLTGNPI